MEADEKGFIFCSWVTNNTAAFFFNVMYKELYKNNSIFFCINWDPFGAR